MLLKFLNRSLANKKSLLTLCCLFICFTLLQHLEVQTQTPRLTFNFINVIGEQQEEIATSNFRIQFFKGKCLGSLNETAAQAVFCDPTRRQSFSFTTDGRLKFDHTGQCLQKMNISIHGPGQLLKLSSCTKALKFKFINEAYLKFINYDSTYYPAMCVSPVSLNYTSLTGYTIQPISNPKQGDLVGLLPCQKEYSTLNLVPDTIFMNKRKALLLPLPPSDSTCDYPVCALNKRAPPAKLLPPQQIRRCHNLADCVTVVTKTARRPHLVVRLAQSIRDVKGYDLPIIAVDDGGEPYSQEIERSVSQFKNLKYIISDNEDLGIALGRTLAVQQVRTKYFLLLDDDSVVSNRTNIELLTDILDSTDASLVGGKITDNDVFAGYLNFGYSRFNRGRELALYKGSCLRLNETIENFPQCMRCDLTTNVFMARTKDILEVGGWSEELKVVEHKDLFLRLKAAHKKVVYCPEFQVYNEQESRRERDQEYQEKRYSRFGHMKALFTNIWTVDNVVETYFKHMPASVLSEIQNQP